MHRSADCFNRFICSLSNNKVILSPFSSTVTSNDTHDVHKTYVLCRTKCAVASDKAWLGRRYCICRKITKQAKQSKRNAVQHIHESCIIFYMTLNPPSIHTHTTTNIRSYEQKK